MRTLVGRYQPSPFSFVREQVELYEATDGREGGTLEGRPIIIVTHRGATSGKLYKSPLMRIPHNGGYLVVASYGGALNNPAWYHNLRTNPIVDVQDGARIITMQAREVPATDTAQLWPVCEARWPHFPEYRARTDRDIPMFMLTPVDGAPATGEAPVNVVTTAGDRFADLAGWPYQPRYVDVAPDLRMHYIDEGPTDGPVLVCLHGEPTWGYLYRKMIPGLLAAGHRVIVPDLIGFGRSDKLTEQSLYSYRAHVGWYGAFVDALDLQAVLLFCQDWGGHIGIAHAAAHPERYRGVIAANAGVLPGIDIDLADDDPFPCWQRYAESLDPFQASLVVAGPSPLNPTGHVLTAEEARAYDAPFPSEQYCAGPRVFPKLVVLRADDPAAGLCQETWKRLASFEKPFLTVLAEHEQSFNLLAPLLQNTIPGAQGQRHTTLAGAGHFLQEHFPNELVVLINDFHATTTS
jgi:haloalkane dehalogenase